MRRTSPGFLNRRAPCRSGPLAGDASGAGNRRSPTSGLLQELDRRGNRRAVPLAPLVPAAGTAHGVLSADRRALLVDRAAEGCRVDRRAPAVLALGKRCQP